MILGEDLYIPGIWTLKRLALEPIWTYELPCSQNKDVCYYVRWGHQCQDPVQGEQLVNSTIDASENGLIEQERSVHCPIDLDDTAKCLDSAQAVLSCQ